MKIASKSAPENPQAEEVLQAARSLNIAPGTPCTKFASEALKAAGYTLDREDLARVNIDLKWFDKNNGTDFRSKSLRDLVEAGTNVTKGVVRALTESGQGTEVSIDRVKPGDFVQYWYNTKDGSIAGHTAVVSDVRSGGIVDLYGSHRTSSTDPDKPPFVGTLNKVDLNNKVAAYAVRPSPVTKSDE